MKSLLRNISKTLCRFGQEYNSCLFVCYGFVCVRGEKALQMKKHEEKAGLRLLEFQNH